MQDIVLEVSLVKTTKNMFVLGNEDGDINFYVPKAYFGGKAPSERDKFKLSISKIETVAEL